MNTIITIGREFGSGGREFARRLADELGYEYYDKEVITEIAKRTDLSENYVKHVVEHNPHELLPITIGNSFAYINSYSMEQTQTVFKEQTKVIKEMAEKSSCVIVGRCADYILKDYKPVRFFIYADFDARIKRTMQRKKDREVWTEKQLKKYMKRVDKARARYYEFYTGLDWGDRSNYDYAINTTNKDIKEIAANFAKMFK